LVKVGRDLSKMQEDGWRFVIRDCGIAAIGSLETSRRSSLGKVSFIISTKVHTRACDILMFMVTLAPP